MRPEIRRIGPSEWQTYKHIRIAALRDAPNAFGSLLEDALGTTDEQWKSRVESASAELDLPLFAVVQTNAVGLAWGKIFSDRPDTAFLFQMWVDPDYRGLRIGALLLQATIDWARRSTAQQLDLSVTIDDSAAWHMYQSAGFIPVGDPEPIRDGATLLAQPMRLAFESGG